MKFAVAFFSIVLLAVNLYGQTGSERRILDTENHIVTVSRNKDEAVFTMEAVTDLTEDRDSSKPLGLGWDFAGMCVDVNNNHVIDERVDVAFGTRQKTNIFCPQYLISETASTGCSVLWSKGTVIAGFKSTALQANPHPVFVYKIPLAELKRGGGTIGIVFQFADAQSRIFFYPSIRRPLSFDETIQLDLSEL